MCRREDYLWESVLSSHSMGLRGQTQQTWQQAPSPLSLLTRPCFTFFFSMNYQAKCSTEPNCGGSTLPRQFVGKQKSFPSKNLPTYITNRGNMGSKGLCDSLTIAHFVTISFLFFLQYTTSFLQCSQIYYGSGCHR